MECEVCGKREAKRTVKIEGAVMEVCWVCAGEQQPIVEEKEIVKKERKVEEESVVDDFAERIRNVREKMGLSVEEVGKKLAISENYLKNIEKGRLIPDISTAKKLEKFFKITLIEKESSVNSFIDKKERKKELSLFEIAEIEEE